MKKSPKSLLGVTLLEIMLVLAIAAMIIVMMLRYYQSASSSQQANSVLNQVLAITAAADSLAQPSGSYQVANISTASLEPLLPNGSNAFITPWGTSITIGSPQSNSYQVTIPDTPSGVCPLLISKLNTNNHYSNLTPATPDACTRGGATSISYTYLANP